MNHLRIRLIVLLLASALPLAASAATAPASAVREDAAATPPPAPAIPPLVRPPTPAEVAAANPIPIWRRNGILVERGGRALYTYAGDGTGDSKCDYRCTALWPPHFAEPGAKPKGPFTIVRSFEGKPMWAFQGKPLYRWISDKKRGAAGGDGVGDVWFLAKVPPGMERQVVMYYPMPMTRTGRPVPPPTAPKPAEGTQR